MSKLKFLLLFINLALLGGQFLLTSAYSASGRELDDISSRLSAISTQNSQLRLAIWEKSALASIRDSAARLNFVQAKAATLSPLSTALVP